VGHLASLRTAARRLLGAAGRGVPDSRRVLSNWCVSQSEQLQTAYQKQCRLLIEVASLLPVEYRDRIVDSVLAARLRAAAAVVIRY